MRFPRKVVPSDDSTETPSDWLPEMRFRVAAVVPPIVLLGELIIRMPMLPVDALAVPAAFVPM
jgi:hypothetical protein